MAVAPLDAVADTGATALGGAGSFTVGAGSDRALYLITSIEGPTSDVTAVDYGGQAMTELAEAVSTGGNDMRTQVWALNDAGIVAASGAGFTATGTSGGTFRSLAFSVSGALQALTLADIDQAVSAITGDQRSVSAVSGGAVIGHVATANSIDVAWVGATEVLEDDNGMTRSVTFDLTPASVTFNATPTITGTPGGGQTSLLFAIQEQALVQASASGTISVEASASATEQPFAPSDLADLLMWYDADDAGTITETGGEISQWDDKSASGFDLVQATAAQQPNTSTANGRASVQFDGGDRLINTAIAGAGDPNDMTIVTVMTPDNINQTEDYIGFYIGTGAARFVGRKINALAQWFIFGAGAATVLADTAVVGETSWQIWRTRSATNGGPDALDSRGTTATQTGGDTPTLGHTQFSIGATPTGGTPYTGHIHEVIIYDRRLSDAERTQISDYLNQKYFLVTGQAVSTSVSGSTASAQRIRNSSAVSASVSGSAAIAPTIAETIGLDSQARRVFVSKTGNDGNDGLSAGAAKLTFQGAFDIAQPGDVISVASGIYYETPTLSNFAGTADDRLWIVAERRGEVTISNLWQEAFEGTQVWDDEGGGTYSAVHGDVWSGSFGDDFLFRYQSQADLEAATLTVNGLAGLNVITKPQYGFAVEGGRIYVKLRGDVDPNGQSIKLTDDFSQVLVDFNNADFVIFDGIRVEGSGSTPALDFDANCAFPIVRNVVTDHCRGLARLSSNHVVEDCEFTKTGFAAWMRELAVLDGTDGDPVIFDINKNYNTSSGNTFYEGGMVFGTASTDTGGLQRRNYIHGVFEGLRAGECDDVDITENWIEDIGDNPVELESFRASDNSSNVRFFFNRVRNSHDASTSHQPGNDFLGPHHVFRNVFENPDPVLASPIFMVKTLNGDTNTNSAEINYYHNLFKSRRGNHVQASPDDLSTIWSDNFSNSDADTIDLFANNVAIFEDGLDTTVGTEVPVTISGNVLAAPSDNAVYQGGGGSRVANEAALLLGANGQLLPGSPLIGTAVAISGSLPDIPGFSQADVGPFPDGFDPGPDWPRAPTTLFNASIPSVLSAGAATSASVSGAVANGQRVRTASATSSSASGSVANGGRLVAGSTSGTMSLDAGATGLRLRLSSADGLLSFGATATSTSFAGAAASGLISMSAAATADPPPAPPVEIPLADSFLDPNNQRPVILVDLFFDNGEVNIWTRPYTGLFEGKQYQPLAGITSGLTVRNSLDQGSLDISVELSGQSDELLNIALTEDFQRRPAVVRLGNLSEDFQEVIASEITIVGTIANMPVSDTEDTATVSVQIDSVFREITRNGIRILRLSAADQALINPDDTFFDFTESAQVEAQRFGGS